jgi:hypothetical protein
MTILYHDAYEFLKQHKYELAQWNTKNGIRYEVRMYRSRPHGLFRREYKSLESAIRNLGLQRAYDEYRLAKWR